MPQQIEITATFLRERMRFANADGDTIIGSAWSNGEISDEITIKGQADIDELQAEQTYRFYGHWTKYRNKRTGKDEQQFSFQSFVMQAPHGRTGVIEYLKSAGEGLGLGAVRCSKLWEVYGSEAIETFRLDPIAVADRLSDFRGLNLSYANAEAIAGRLRERVEMEHCTLEMMDILTGRGFPKATARLAIREWGNLAPRIIRRNPYRLMNFRGCGFKRCDALWLSLGLPPGRLKRQALCAWYTIASDTEGHTWYAAEFAERGIRGSIAGADLRVDDAIELANRAGYTAMLTTHGAGGPIAAEGNQRWIAEGKKSRHEAELAELIADAMREKDEWPDVSGLQISEHQYKELNKALRGAIAILGGSPGTGKTYSAALLIRRLVEIYGIDQIAVGAPTGKAAVRVTEALAGYGLPLRARTWHSMLARLDMSGNPNTPFPYRVLIGDETSMVDTDLMTSIFRRRARGTHVLLVGDINQLPPVGHGAPLRDLIAAGLPYGELREIKRASGGIVEACAAIRDGQRWAAGDNLRIEERGTADSQISTMLRELADASGNYDPIWDCQVLVPVNDKSQLSRKALNKILQNELNPNGGSEGSPFRVGDKIVNTKNGYFPSVEADRFDDELQENERGEVYVANGELAEVIAAEEKLTIARLSNPARTIKIPRGKAVEREGDDDQVADDKAPATGCSWDLGYALSVHKSQGSEWPVVICMIDDYPGAKMVCSREFWYTAISRTRDLCVLIGRKSTIDQGVRRVALGKRKTFLRERIHLSIAMRELAEL